MEEITDIHKVRQQFESLERRVQGDKSILPSNKKHLERFTEIMKASALKPTTMRKHLYSMRFVALHCDKDFRKVSKDDIIKICARIEQQKWTPATKHAHLVAIKKFFKWLSDIDDKGVYPPEVRWISTSEKNSKRKLPEDLLTEDEVEQMLQAADTPRDKAFTLLLYETGGRIGEILNIKIKHVVFQSGIGFVMLNGKTGMRRVTIVASVPILASYIDVHPSKNNPDSFLFMTKFNHIEGRKGYVQLTYAGANKILKTLAKKSGIRKRIHPHLFRHSSATRAAKFLTEAQMKAYYGWTGGSDMPSVYVHMSARDTEDAIKRMNGLTADAPQQVKATIVTCRTCKQKNSPGSKYCNSCGAVLSLDAAITLNTILQNSLLNAQKLLTKSDEEILREHRKRA